MAQDNILTLNRLRYFKWSFVLVLLCVGLYAFDNPPLKPGGGTWLGYGLGTLGALLILWLMLFGLRKRAYGSNMGTVRGWLSAHVYLGIALAVVATLHTGFEFGWNIHTLAYALTIAVILSGFWGVIIYMRTPALMSGLLNGHTLQENGQILRDIDDQCKRLAQAFSPQVQAQVASSASGHIFSAGWQRFTGRNSTCATRVALAALEKHSEADHKGMQEICTLQFRRLQQLGRIREFVRLKSWTELWLLFHVPMSFALLASLTAHIVSVFFYW